MDFLILLLLLGSLCCSWVPVGQGNPGFVGRTPEPRLLTAEPWLQAVVGTAAAGAAGNPGLVGRKSEPWPLAVEPWLQAVVGTAAGHPGNPWLVG